MVGMGKMSKAIWSERASRFIEGAAETAMNLRASSGNFLRALLLGVSLSALGTSDAFAGAVRVIGRTSGVDHGTRMEYYQQAQAEGEAATAAFVALGNASAAQVHAGNAAGLQELRDGKEAMELAASMARTGFAVRRDSAWTDASEREARAAGAEADRRTLQAGLGQGLDLVATGNAAAAGGIALKEKIEHDATGAVLGITTAVVGKFLGN